MKVRDRCIFLLAVMLATVASGATTEYGKYVDPFIGSVGSGNVVVGPSCPYGMVKPGPDCSRYANAGYRADPASPILDFSQLHVSGTGGGAKYGNISVMPFVGESNPFEVSSLRQNETASLGYYAVDLEKWGIRTEITASPKVAFYRFGFNGPGEARRSIKINAAEMLGESGAYPAREASYFIGSETEVVSEREVRGYARVRGGWNNGGPYTVYFAAVFDQPCQEIQTWANGKLYSGVKSQVNGTDKTGAVLTFDPAGDRTVRVKIGISFLSAAKARLNVDTEIPGWDFEATLAETRARWEDLLSRIAISPEATDSQKRLFYTGLYHTMLMPSDRTGENPLWKSKNPAYDDFYTLWDTYRTSLPLITLIDPSREADIVKALLDIYLYEGYLPDGRSGNSNGRTQGGSNAENVIADAYVKKLKGIDYALALKAMLKDADVPPGGNEEQEGRGGLPDYNTLGYVSMSYPRSGNRTVEYAYNDFCIAAVARGLGETAIFERFAKQAGNWKNLWRADATQQGATGFIMPRDAKGKWVDNIVGTAQGKEGQILPFTPDYVSSINFEDNWACFLYEGASWDYSLSIPHDVAGLIALCGGPEAFKSRLDTFFNKRHYYVGNEPGFLSPTLYHWIGRPELSSARIHEIVGRAFNDGRKGIPGNDDSGAMSSWLAFHLMGIYPNAGQSYYLINTPFVPQTVLHLEGGKTFKIVANHLSDKNLSIVAARLNGQPLTRTWLEHDEITAGGLLELDLADAPAAWGHDTAPPSLRYTAAE